MAPQAPGVAVRVLGHWFSGVRRSGQQIRDYADGWRLDAEAAMASPRPVLLVFGDSLSQGIGASARSRSYVSLVAAELSLRRGADVAVLNLSRSGARIDDVLEVQVPAYEWAREHRAPEVVTGICTVGSNDLLRSGRLGRAKRAMSELIERLPEGVAMATVPDRGSVVAKRLNDHLRREAEREHRPVADVAAALTSWRGRVAGDRFHPNDRGHRLWADVVLAGYDAGCFQ